MSKISKPLEKVVALAALSLAACGAGADARLFDTGGTPVAALIPALPMIMPWMLPGIALTLALGPQAPEAPPAMAAMVPVVATALWTVVFTAVAIWRFGREEF